MTVYSLGSNGNVAPIASIGGSNTGFDQLRGIAPDSQGNIYAVNANGGPSGIGSITIYPAGSNGNVAPSAIIAGDQTGLDYPNGIALDSAGYIYVTNQAYPYSITIYQPGSNGNVTPSITISGASTLLDDPFDLALDSGGNIYVTNDFPAYSAGSVLVYPALASLPAQADVVPITAIISSDTNNSLYEPQGIALDSKGNIYVANYAANDVTVYSPNTFGLIAQIQGGSTGISSPMGIALDSAGDIYVANCGEVCSGVLAPPDSITVFAPLASLPTYPETNIAPIATISGSNTGFSAPWFIAIGP